VKSVRLMGRAEAAVEEAMDLDRAYFEKHPEETQYIREAIPFEFPPMRLDPPAPGATLMVRVISLGPGLRARTTHWVMFP
jgi:hypothetical protein